MALAALLAACSARQVSPGSVVHSDKGYRVAIPGEAWTPIEGGPADLQFRHRDGEAGILVVASCDSRQAARPAAALGRQLLVGLVDRVVLERQEVTLAGRPARRLLLDAAGEQGADRMRIEAWTLTDGRCVFDLVYAAPPARFSAWHGDFQRVVESFVLEP